MSDFDDELKRLLRDYQATFDRELFGKLAVHIEKKIRSALRYFGVRDPSTIDDITQDVFIKILEKAKQKKIRVDGNPMALICKMAINLAIDRFRSDTRRGMVPLGDDDYAITDDIDGNGEAIAELLQAIQDLRAHLPERERLLFETRFDPDNKVTWDEAAIALGWTPRQGQRVQERLRQKLKALEKLAKAYYGNSMKPKKKAAEK